MNSQPLRRAALAMLLGMALLTSGCAADTTAQPDETPAASATETAGPSPTATTDPSPTATSEPGVVDPDCPTPPAGSPAGTPDDPYALGDEVVTGCFTVVLLEVDVDATDAIVNANPQATLSAGNGFMTVTLMITRTDGDPAPVSDLSVRLVGSTTTDADPEPGLVLPEQQAPAGTLAAGQSTGGMYVFEISGGASTWVILREGAGPEVSVMPY